VLRLEAASAAPSAAPNPVAASPIYGRPWQSGVSKTTADSADDVAPGVDRGVMVPASGSPKPVAA
jgi:hypothetical protein